MSDQSHAWSAVAADYETDFVDPYRRPGPHPLLDALDALPAGGVAADLGCGQGPLLPRLAARFDHVHAVDFAEAMLARARQRCTEAGLANVTFHQRSLTDLAPLAGAVDVAVAVNSLVMPALADLGPALRGVRACLRPGGRFLGIVPAMDGIHYQTMLLLDRARRRMPEDKAKQNAAHLGEHQFYDFAFGEFHYRGLVQHFWQPFEVRYRLRRAGFRNVRLTKVRLAWDQFAGAADLARYPAPWDWAFQAEVPHA